jgi:hypothetical protein
MQALDLECAKIAKEISDYIVKETGGKAKDVEKAEHDLQTLIGVLQEEGVYAFCVLERAKFAKLNLRSCEALLLRTIGLSLSDKKEPMDYIRDTLSGDLNLLLLYKQLLERTLIYVRYHLRGRASGPLKTTQPSDTPPTAENE